MAKTQKVALREMTDDMFDVLDTSRKGYLEIEDMVRFFYGRSVPLSETSRQTVGMLACAHCTALE